MLETNMDGKFTDYMIRELKDLISDMEAGLMPANLTLYEQVMGHLRREFDRRNPARLVAD
jgi:hypothetical protein